MHDGSEPAAAGGRFRAALAGVRPYAGGMTLAAAQARYGALDFAKLASNENLLGPSPAVPEAIAAAAAEAHLYPDPFSEALREALAAQAGWPAERVIVAPGSEALIDYLFTALIEPGDEVMISSPTFPRYAISAAVLGGRIRDVPREADFSLDVPAIEAALAERAPRLLVICTPNNPTGDAIAEAELRRLLAATPTTTAILFDEAYREYEDSVDTLGLLEAWGGTFLLTRTFSKAYGLAGLRIGYGLASSAEVVVELDKLRPHFNMTNLSHAAAVAALGDQAHLARVVASAHAERERIHAFLAERGLEPSASRANFVFFRSPLPAAEAFERLLAQGIIVRPIPTARGDYLRVSVGAPAHTDRFLTALADLLEA
jgi:histidinol-phosphate aminotransferase